MSVIFRSLQKLKAQAGQDYRPALPYNRSPRRITGLRPGRLANLRVVSLVLLMFLSGIGTAFGIYKISGDAPGTAPADKAAGRAASAMDPGREPAVAFFPAKESTPPRRDTGYWPATKINAARREGGALQTAAAPIPPVPASVRRATAGTGSAAIANTAASGRPAAGIRRPSNSAATVAEPRGRPAGREKKAAPKIARQNLQRSLEINRLVGRIRSCMAAADCRQIDPLFERLQALKGARNPYVLKLKGYWHLRQDRFESAADLLQQVLIQDENDLEANVNMAIAEMRLNRRRQARQRLARLREIYPDHAKLAEVWEQLN